MSTDPCDGCGRDVTIAGGIANLWTMEGTQTGGITLELSDGSEHFLCYTCIERLPDDREPTAEDVAALPPYEEDVDADEDGSDDR
ncbi:hypothetical protein BRD00_05335 [Halobacteriales archaeon QS_8_69_26]|nr:MAG: hypothetical protein BRD00_05335 [Halobacteriales archaeon QS_8_69_26]